MNYYSILRKFAKSIRAQNLFFATKEISSIHLFRNNSDLSNLQEIFLTWLYNYDYINRDIETEKISKHVLDNDLYTDAYLIWKNNKKSKQKNDKKLNALHLVNSHKIKF